MHFLEQVPIPTPTPSITQLQNELTQITSLLSQSLSKGQDYVTNTGLLGVIFAAIIAWVFVSYIRRGQGNELSSVIKTQNRLIENQDKRAEEDRQDRKAENARREQIEAKFQDRYIESISALTAAQEANCAVVAEVKAIAVSFNTREIQTADMLESMATKGSPPVQELKTAMETAIKALTRIEARLEPFDELVTTLSDIKRKLNIAEFASDKLIEEATAIKRKTGQLPVIAVDATPTPQLGATT